MTLTARERDDLEFKGVVFALVATFIVFVALIVSHGYMMHEMRAEVRTRIAEALNNRTNSCDVLVQTMNSPLWTEAGRVFLTALVLEIGREFARVIRRRQ